MSTAYNIEKPQKNTPFIHRTGRFNKAILYTTLLCAPMNVMGECNHLSQFQYGFQACTNCNNSSSSLDDIFEGERLKLKQSLEYIAKLSPNWDGYDAPVIGKKAIQNSKHILDLLPNNIILDLKVYPTEYGGVQVIYNDKLRNKKVSIDLGDDLMSFYVCESDKTPQFFSYLSYDKDNIKLLLIKISENIA